MAARMAATTVALLRLLAADVCPAASPTGDDERIAVVVGANIGNSTDEPLLYAERDARRFHEVLVDLADVRPERAMLVLRPGPETVLRALREARGRAAELRAAGRRVAFFFYYSGHGDDATLHLPRGNLPLAELRQAVGDIPADLRISILDACRTGGSLKGVSRGPSFALTVAPEAPHGTVELRASSLGEAAQESNELGGSLFTHFLASGLRGAADADRDGQVTLAELYAYVYRRTLLRSATGVALQHPALTVNLAGAGEVVVSHPARATAFLEVPAGADRYLVFARRTATVVGELSGEGTSRLALPPGQFLVARRRGTSTSVAQIDLSWGGVRMLGERDFRSVSREELAARGGGLELRPNRIEAQAGVELALTGGEGPALRAGVGWSRSWGPLVLSIDGSYVHGSLDTAAFGGAQDAVAGGPQVAWRWFLGKVTLSALAGVELRYAWEHLRRRDAERAAAAGFPATEERAYGAIGPRVGVRLTVPLGRSVTATFDTSCSLLFRLETTAPSDSQITLHPVIFPTLALGYAF